MTVTLSYDGSLARVAVSGPTWLNLNPFFETDASDWSAAGGTFVRSTAQFHQGAAAGLLTPDGVTAAPQTNTTSRPATVGQIYRAQAWVRCAVSRNVDIRLSWRDAGDAQLSETTVTVAVTANTWQLVSVTAAAPASTTQARTRVAMTGTPLASHLLYIDEAILTADPVNLERSTDQIRWTTVRGGAGLADGTPTVYDYEFAPGVANYYRMTSQSSANITPVITQPWLKSVLRPNLNVAISPDADTSGPTWTDRSAVFPIKGRSLPIGVTDLRGGRELELCLETDTLADGETLRLGQMFGDTVYLQIPPGYPELATGYYVVGPLRRDNRGKDPASETFWWYLPLREVAAPKPGVVGVTVTWADIPAHFADWNAVVAGFATWADVPNYVASPADILVP